MQGVFFRRTVSEHAQHLGISGWVRNLPDGSVEILAQGKQAVLEEFVERLYKEPGSAKIDRIEHSYTTTQQPLKGFSVIR